MCKVKQPLEDLGQCIVNHRVEIGKKRLWGSPCWAAFYSIRCCTTFKILHCTGVPQRRTELSISEESGIHLHIRCPLWAALCLEIRIIPSRRLAPCTLLRCSLEETAHSKLTLKIMTGFHAQRLLSGERAQFPLWHRCTCYLWRLWRDIHFWKTFVMYTTRVYDILSRVKNVIGARGTRTNRKIQRVSRWIRANSTSLVQYRPLVREDQHLEGYTSHI